MNVPIVSRASWVNQQKPTLPSAPGIRTTPAVANQRGGPVRFRTGAFVAANSTDVTYAMRATEP